MYGYILPDIDKLEIRDFVVYRAFYCGVCKSIGRRLGTVVRMATGYDLAFLGLLVANYTGQNVDMQASNCIGHPLRKSIMASGTDIVDRVADLTVLLAMNKLRDDIDDDNSFKARLAKGVISKAYRRARQSFGVADDVIRQHISRLNTMQGQWESSVDMVSDCFASLTRDVARLLCNNNTDDNFDRLCYNVGKFIYLIDALDDIDSDYLAGEYNPFLAGLVSASSSVNNIYAGVLSASDIRTGKTRRLLMDKCRLEIEFAISSTTNKIIEYFNNAELSGCYDLLQNIVHLGLRKKYNQILQSDKKLRRFDAERALRYPRHKIKAYNKTIAKGTVQHN